MSEFSAIAFTLVNFVIAYFLWQRFVTGRTEWMIDSNEIKIVWIKKFFLADCEDMIFKWKEIENISKGPDRHYDNLKIKFTSGEIVRFFHDNLTTKDDFEEMLMTLYKTLSDKKATANTCLLP